MHYFYEPNDEGVEERKSLEVELVRFFFTKTYRIYFMQEEMISNESFSYFLQQFFGFKVSGTINKISENENGLQIWHFNVFIPYVDENGSDTHANITFTLTHQIPVQEAEVVEDGYVVGIPNGDAEDVVIAKPKNKLKAVKKSVKKPVAKKKTAKKATKRR